MILTNLEWPGSANLVFAPTIWQELIEAISRSLGLNVDASTSCSTPSATTTRSSSKASDLGGGGA